MRRAALLLLLSPLLFAQDAAEEPWRFKTLKLREGGDLEYALVLPEAFDAKRPYPLLLALPPGPQTREMVEAGLRRYWGHQAARRGWIVVSPVAPKGANGRPRLFHRGGEKVLPELIRRLRIDYRIHGNRMHLAGASNGGRSAFRVAVENPFEFQSLVVLPGFPSEHDQSALSRLRWMKVRLFVGGADTRWIAPTKRTAEQLKSLGIDVESRELPGEGHVPPSLDGDVIMTRLESLHGSRKSSDPASVALDDFHDAAAKGDGPRYFGRFAPEGVFLGTDATERWTLEEFKAWGGRYFERESAWIFVPQKRNLEFAPDGKLAWFDEVLGSAHYGECRGSGVLRLINERWTVSQYNLTVPVPNALLGDVVRRIRLAETGAGVSLRVILVRHAEKAGGDDPDLNETGQRRAGDLARTLRSLGVDALYASEFKRTQQTLVPLAKALSKKTKIHPARRSAALVEKLRKEHRNQTVVICGHSNTLPVLMEFLGVEDPPTLGEKDYDDLFMVDLDAAGARMTTLHYGEAIR